METIQSTAGAVPILNEKGEVSMQKVKVHRYVSGKRPEYAPGTSSEDEASDDDSYFINRQRASSPPSDIPIPIEKILATEDPRIKRLMIRNESKEDDNSDAEDRQERRKRRVQEPEVLDLSESEGEEKEDKMEKKCVLILSDDEEEEEELSDSEIQRRREMLKRKVLTNKQARVAEVLDKEEEGRDSDESGSESEYEEYTDSEEEMRPRMKPVFVRKKDRLTILEKEKEAAKKKQMEMEAKRKAEERRRQTIQMVEEAIRKETAVTNAKESALNDVNTDDENDENVYDLWKQRETKRMKRDREEKEKREKEAMDIERLRNMTEEERRQELRLNPKSITNKMVKGKYKFMQKYYHRGAFYLDEENPLLKRNFAAATLEDHFDKTVLPKVMQVKNFGRSGRTKYTHLVEQDTTQFDSPWFSNKP